jgi:hypothetical protein
VFNPSESTPPDTETLRIYRIKLTAPVAFYGFLIGCSATLIGIIAQTEKYADALRLPFLESVVLAIFGGVSAALIASVFVYILRSEAYYPPAKFTYLIIGLIFWIVWPMLVGFSMPVAFHIIAVLTESVTISQFFSELADQMLIGVVSSIALGTLYIYTSFFASVTFVTGTYLIDFMNQRSNHAFFSPKVWGTAFVIGMIPLVLTCFLSPELLRKIG